MTEIANPAPPRARTVVRGFSTFSAARHAHDVCQVVGHIPDRRMTVVARGLEWREPLRGTALIQVCASVVAVSGAVVALVLWLVGITSPATGWLEQTIYGALAGVAAGAVAGAGLALARGRRPELVPTGHVEPSEYDLLVEEDVAPIAQAVLERES